MDIQAADLLTIGLLVVLEGLLSADNALVLAILVLALPREDQRKALRYGILGAFLFRILATLLAVELMSFSWVKLIGAAYLMYLSVDHFFGRHSGGSERRRIKPAKPALGLTPLWATVVKVEGTDIVFAIDSILVAVAMSTKTWVVVSGGLLGIAAIRMVIGQLLGIVRRYPALVDGAFIIIAWVSIKLFIEYLHASEFIHFEVNKYFSFALIIAVFLSSYLYARRQGAVADDQTATDEATDLFRSDAK
jgi:YkoY family integral membrane protein